MANNQAGGNIDTALNKQGMEGSSTVLWLSDASSGREEATWKRNTTKEAKYVTVKYTLVFM